MSDMAEFSLLVGDIYDAALDSSLWPLVLEKICRFVPGAYANIFIQDANNRFANSVFSWGVDPVYFESYLKTYAKLNPAFPAGFFFDVGEVFSVYDILPREQLERTRFYKEWVAPQGVRDSPGAILEKSSTSCALFAVALPDIQPHPFEHIRERLQLLVPHVQRAVLIGKAFDLQRAVAADFTATVDALKAAIFLVDAQGRIVHANPSAMTMLGAEEVLYGASSRLRSYDRAADQSLSEFFVACASGDDLAIGSNGAAIHLPSRLRPVSRPMSIRAHRRSRRRSVSRPAAPRSR
jgi:PAS domain-containing protein